MSSFGSPSEYFIYLNSLHYNVFAGAVGEAVTSVANTRASALFIFEKNIQINRIALPTSTKTNTYAIASRVGIATTVPIGTAAPISFLSSTILNGQYFDLQQYSVVPFDTVTLSGAEQYFACIEEQIRASSASPSHQLPVTTNQGSIASLWEFPYNVSNGTRSAGMSNWLLGFYNGQYTQWYGQPYIGTTLRALNNSGATIASAGCRFNIKANFRAIKVYAVQLEFSKGDGHDVKLEIFESDNTTKVQNATALVLNSYVSGASNKGQYKFIFDNIVTLKPYTNYYIKISATGTAADGTNVYVSRINGSSLVASDSLAAEFQNAFSIDSVYSETSTSDVYTEYENGKLNAILICTSLADDFRSTAETGAYPGAAVYL